MAFLTMEVSAAGLPHQFGTASVLQASSFRSDVTVFRLNAPAAAESGLETAFRRNVTERVYAIEAAHNPEVAGSNPAPATLKGLQMRACHAHKIAVSWRTDRHSEPLAVHRRVRPLTA